MESVSYYESFKILIQGANKSYKTFIINSLILNKPVDDNKYLPTKKVDKINTAIIVDPQNDIVNIKYQDIEIYDCMGTNYTEDEASQDFIKDAIHSFNNSLKNLCHKIDLTLIFFDINNKNSFEEMKN